MEIVELKDHPFFVGVQSLPEYLSRVLRPSPPYLGFVAACCGLLDEMLAQKETRINGATYGNEHVNGALNGVRKVSGDF